MNTNFSFTFQIVSALVDPVARPGVWQLGVQISELPMTATSEKPVTIMLGNMGAASTADLDNIGAQLQITMRSAVRSTVESIAFRVKNPTQAALIDKIIAQWTPVGIPKAFFSDKLGEPYQEPRAPKPPFELHQRVAWKDDGEMVHHGEIVHISEVCIEETPIIKLFLDEGSNVDCYENDIRPLLCSDCGEPQMHTPSGPVCRNGHGGATPKEPEFK